MLNIKLLEQSIKVLESMLEKKIICQVSIDNMQFGLMPGKTGQVGLGVGSWPSNRATVGSNPKGTRLYFVILLKNVEKIFDWH